MLAFETDITTYLFSIPIPALAIFRIDCQTQLIRAIPNLFFPIFIDHSFAALGAKEVLVQCVY